MILQRQQVAIRILSNTSKKRKRRGSRFKDRLTVQTLAEGERSKVKPICWIASRCRQNVKSGRRIFWSRRDSLLDEVSKCSGIRRRKREQVHLIGSLRLVARVEFVTCLKRGVQNDYRVGFKGGGKYTSRGVITIMIKKRIIITLRDDNPRGFSGPGTNVSPQTKP